MRSDIAATWAVRLGYTNVKRFPHGYAGWKSTMKAVAVDSGKPCRLAVGDPFPSARFTILNTEQDADYLKIPDGNRRFSLDHIVSDFLIVWVYNERCYACVNETENYKKVFREIEADETLRNRVHIVGIGTGSKKRQVAKYRKTKKIGFPLFADEKWSVFTRLGSPALPVSYLIRGGQKKNREIVHVQSDLIDNTADYLTRIRRKISE